jgi:hypothetical protein
VNHWAVRDDMYMYCTVCCTFLYVLVQHARELQTTDNDMYLDTSSPGPSNKLESTLVGIPSVQNMWRGLSRGTREPSSDGRLVAKRWLPQSLSVHVRK